MTSSPSCSLVVAPEALGGAILACAMRGTVVVTDRLEKRIGVDKAALRDFSTAKIAYAGIERARASFASLASSSHLFVVSQRANDAPVLFSVASTASSGFRVVQRRQEASQRPQSSSRVVSNLFHHSQTLRACSLVVSRTA